MTHFFSYDSDSGSDSDTDTEINVAERSHRVRTLRVDLDTDKVATVNPPNSRENELNDTFSSTLRLAFISFVVWMVYEAVMKANRPDALETPSTNFFGL